MGTDETVTREARPDRRRKTGLKVSLAFLVMWMIPALLSVMQGYPAMTSFLHDFALHVRALVAVPVFIIGEYSCLPLLREIAGYFGCLVEDKRNRFDFDVASMRSFRISTKAVIVSTLCTYAIVATILGYAPMNMVPSWQQTVGRDSLSFAGWWYWLISVPLLLVLTFLWLWRIFLWSRFLWQMSRLHLRLVPSHPDHAAGLKFLGYSPIAFAPLCLALSAMMSGTIANRVLHFNESPSEYKYLALGFVIVEIILFCGPLTLFAGKLFAARRHGIWRYSSLASGMGRRLERKWLERPEGGLVNEGALEAPDFSATADFYQSVENVYDMNLIPIDLRSLFVLVAAAVLPFLPVALLYVPFETILEKLSSLLM